MSAQADLRGAIVAALRADAALTAVIGADRVHDGAPRGAAIPFVDLGAVETRLLAATPGYYGYKIEMNTKRAQDNNIWSFLVNSTQHNTTMLTCSIHVNPRIFLT